MTKRAAGTVAAWAVAAGLVGLALGLVVGRGITHLPDAAFGGLAALLGIPFAAVFATLASARADQRAMEEAERVRDHGERAAAADREHRLRMAETERDQQRKFNAYADILTYIERVAAMVPMWPLDAYLGRKVTPAPEWDLKVDEQPHAKALMRLVGSPEAVELFDQWYSSYGDAVRTALGTPGADAPQTERDAVLITLQRQVTRHESARRNLEARLADELAVGRESRVET